MYLSNSLTPCYLCFFFIYFQMMSRIFGHPVVFVTSRVAKIDVIWNLNHCTVGSGRQIVKKWHQPIKYHLAGASILGPKLDTRKLGSLITRNSILMVPTSPVCLYLTTFTTTASLGMMLLATTRNLSFAKIPRSSSIMSQIPTVVSVCERSTPPQANVISRRSFSSESSTPTPFSFSLLLHCKRDT